MVDTCPGFDEDFVVGEGCIRVTGVVAGLCLNVWFGWDEFGLGFYEWDGSLSRGNKGRSLVAYQTRPTFLPTECVSTTSMNQVSCPRTHSNKKYKVTHS